MYRLPFIRSFVRSFWLVRIGREGGRGMYFGGCWLRCGIDVEEMEGGGGINNGNT